MSKSNVPALDKRPFWLGDALLVILATLVMILSDHPMDRWLVASYVICFACGAWLAILPFLAEYRAAVKLAEAGGLATTVRQINNLEQVTAQITTARSQLQSALDQSAKTVTAADEIATRMTTEAKAFAEFMKKANDTERAHLRLEVEKLRRTEAEWVQVVVRMLDHTFALAQAAQRSAQPSVAAQLNQFQNACRDAARRVGLTAFAAQPGDPFDAKTHQLTDTQAAPAAGVRVAETLATGYTFQGQLIRPALVQLEPQRPQPAEQLPLPESAAPARPVETEDRN